MTTDHWGGSRGAYDDCTPLGCRSLGLGRFAYAVFKVQDCLRCGVSEFGVFGSQILGFWWLVGQGFGYWDVRLLSVTMWVYGLDGIT